MAATIGDIIFLAIVLGVITALFLNFKPGRQGGKGAVETQKENLKKMGINITDGGLSVKTNARAMSQEEYVERTQRRLAQGSETIAKHKDAFAWGAKK